MRRPLLYSLLLLSYFFIASAEEAPAVARETLGISESIQPRYEGAYWFYKSLYFEGGRAVSNGTTKEEVVRVLELDGMACWKVQLTMDWRSLFDRLAGEKLMEHDFDYFWEFFDTKGSYHFADWDEDTDQMLTPQRLKDFVLTLQYPVEAGHSTCRTV